MLCLSMLYLDICDLCLYFHAGARLPCSEEKEIKGHIISYVRTECCNSAAPFGLVWRHSEWVREGAPSWLLVFGRGVLCGWGADVH